MQQVYHHPTCNFYTSLGILLEKMSSLPSPDTDKGVSLPTPRPVLAPPSQTANALDNHVVTYGMSISPETPTLSFLPNNFVYEGFVVVMKISLLLSQQYTSPRRAYEDEVVALSIPHEQRRSDEGRYADMIIGDALVGRREFIVK
jgi:hypothetical protein